MLIFVIPALISHLARWITKSIPEKETDFEKAGFNSLIEAAGFAYSKLQNIADYHIAIHFDGDGLDYDKGIFYMAVPDGIKNMYPVSTIWQEDDRLGESLVEGLRTNGLKIMGSGSVEMDLTQTSYSKIPSVDIELGNQCTDHNDSYLSELANGLKAGVDLFFGQEVAFSASCFCLAEQNQGAEGDKMPCSAPCFCLAERNQGAEEDKMLCSAPKTRVAERIQGAQGDKVLCSAPKTCVAERIQGAQGDKMLCSAPKTRVAE